MNVVRISARAVLAFFVLVQNLLPFLVSAGVGAGNDAHGAHLGGFLVGLLSAWVVNRRLRSARSAPAGADHDAAPPPPGTIAALVEEGDFENAARRYVQLSSAETRRLLGERHSMMLGTWMAAGPHPHAALALFERHVRDHPVSSTTAAAHLAAGLLQMRTFGECVFRRKWNTDFGRSGTSISEEVEHRFREVEHGFRDVERPFRGKWNTGSGVVNARR